MKRKMRQSGIDYLKMLPLGIRDRAIYNISISYKERTWEILAGRYENMRCFINNSMIWNDTKEGQKFWSCLHDTDVKNAVTKFKEHLKTVPITKP